MATPALPRLQLLVITSIAISSLWLQAASAVTTTTKIPSHPCPVPPHLELDISVCATGSVVVKCLYN